MAAKPRNRELKVIIVIGGALLLLLVVGLFSQRNGAFDDHPAVAVAKQEATRQGKQVVEVLEVQRRDGLEGVVPNFWNVALRVKRRPGGMGGIVMVDVDDSGKVLKYHAEQ